MELGPMGLPLEETTGRPEGLQRQVVLVEPKQ